MALTLSYAVQAQIVDSDQIITCQLDMSSSKVLPTSEADDLNTILVDAGAVNQQLPLLNPAGVDLIILQPTQDAVFRIGTVESFPLPVKAGKIIVVDSTGVPAVFVTNTSSTAKLKVRFIQAVTRTP